ncbi:VOC family protein [Pimelobacter simplex]|uniref:VOC family protein n=1 Tax=Nocardioides simplex TaxID=2045 RepID=UPI00214F6DB0|nr:VOC family protein [Pimelobacter simplex]UUW89763.1 VOC family protein [Pimelobacter simplex]UUW93592.1 VOC family protein [Pimelobacter simplex]
MLTIAELEIADPPQPWREAGFVVGEDGAARVGGVRLRFAGRERERGRGIVGWSLGGLPEAWAGDLDGVPTGGRASDAPAGAEPPGEHPNGVTVIDHVVLLSPDLDRTRAVLAALGAEERRVRDGHMGGAPVRQVFYRFGEVVLEVVGAPDAAGEGPASLWGVTFTVADIDAAARLLGERTAPVKDAVQPGRRITTVRHRDLGMSVRTALISAPVRRATR